MGKDAVDINWTSLKKKIKEIAPLVTTLKRQNDELDTLMVQLYDVFQTKNSLSFYKCYAGHIDNKHLKNIMMLFLITKSLVNSW